MIDLHCHILHGVDDGPAELEDTLKMLAQATQDGITDIVATPHHRNRKFINDKQSVLQGVEALNKVVQERGFPITIHPGQEIRLYGELIEDYQKGELLTLGGTSKYALLELPSSAVPSYTKQTVYELLVEGVTPIIAHPERNSSIVENPSKLYDLIVQGATSQVTAASVAGDFGKRLQSFSLDLIENGLAHFIASDAHDTEKRGFAMTRALQVLHHTFGHDYHVLENAHKVLHNERLILKPPSMIEKKSFWAKLLNR